MNRILVVDDNPINLDVAKSVLQSKNYEITTATSGKEALELANGDEIDLIILDVSMPEMDGFEVCKRLGEHEKTARIPVIFLTAHMKGEESVVRGLEMGANDYITKPIKNSELLARVAVMLRIKEAEDRVLAQNRELEEANEKLKEADRLKSEFVSVVSHDLGAPLTIMKGNLELLQTQLLGPLNKRQPVADMVMLGRDKTPELKVRPIPELRFYCDPYLIRQVLDNYISNALRYTPEAGIIEVGAEETKDNNGGKALHIEVKDSGRGVSPDDAKKIFERFYRSGPKVKGSTGLGLAIVKGIVEAHGGRVWCESDGKSGSTFNATIPGTGKRDF